MSSTILEIEDHWHRRIRLSATVWEYHILYTHPELKGYLHSVESTLEDPDFVYFDAFRPDAECFYRKGALFPVSSNLLKVVVRFIDNDEHGFVTTAYVSRNVRSMEQSKWRK